jgi:hypothetical protein
MPQVVYVQFKDAKWPKLKGTTQKGLYPIRPVTRPWYLDQHRAVPKLKVTRRQFPLIPAFAMTAHAAQGKTLDKAIVDLCIGEDSSALTGYVALSRVRDKESIWIFRPFPLRVFQQSHILGPHLLLDHLQGKEIDWEALKKKLQPKEGADAEVQCRGGRPQSQAKRKAREDEKQCADDSSEDSSQSMEPPRKVSRSGGLEKEQARKGRPLVSRQCECGETQASQFSRDNFTKCRSCCVTRKRAVKKCLEPGCGESRWEEFNRNNNTLCKRCAGRKTRGVAKQTKARKR